MAEKKIDLLDQLHDITDKFKKKRILKKPNPDMIAREFEMLALDFERDDLPHYSGLCYQGAAKCQNSLGNNLEEGLLLLKSSRQFMSSYVDDVNNSYVPNPSLINHSYMLYEECLERLTETEELSKPVKEALTGSIALEMADNLKIKADFPTEACQEYEKALKLFSDSPIEKINCLKKIISLKIEERDYKESLKLIDEVIKETQRLPKNGIKENILRESEITRIFLILILRPTVQQISPTAAACLEKYAWVETSNKNDFTDLSTTLKNQGLSMLSEDLFLNLQSLVMSCQYNDLDDLDFLEKSLGEFINNEQKSLLRILIKQYKN